MPNFDSRCTVCDWNAERVEKVGEIPPCPKCCAPVEHHWVPNHRRYHEDAIPGGLVIENLGRDPVTVFSHSERKRLMRERGLQEAIYHVDGDTHTSNWNVGTAPGVDPRPMHLLSPDEQAARHAAWLATEP